MKYCQVLRERHVTAQKVLLSRLGIAEGDIIMQQGFAGMLKPSYVLVLDHQTRCVVLAIRGTHSVKVRTFGQVEAEYAKAHHTHPCFLIT